MISLQQSAPDFKLFNTEKKEISLQEQKGKNVLLLFFPLAFTSTCTAELCSIRDNYKQYEALNATVFGISTDSLFTLKKFKAEQNLNFDLLSDYNKEVSAQYGALYETWGFGMKGVTKRAAFVVDKNGNIQYAEVLENASDLPNFDAFNKVLQSLN
jgi:glutaredoxin-dependent peroxiredoxin